MANAGMAQIKVRSVFYRLSPKAAKCARLRYSQRSSNLPLSLFVLQCSNRRTEDTKTSPGQMLVSQTVKDLVAGSGTRFEYEWRVYGVLRDSVV